MRPSAPNADGQTTEDGEADAVLDALLAQPYALYQPARQTVPFVFASPHSGRDYPQRFLNQSRLAPLDLRKSEDAFVDELFDCAPSFGAPLIAARFPRAFVDANRAPGELDPALFGRATTYESGSKSARVAVGLGVIPRIVRDGLEIYGGRLDGREAEFRLSGFYKPYHSALCDLIAETIAQFGIAVVVDCHSMPAPPRRTDIVLGDRYGESASADLIGLAQKTLIGLGFDVARNAPYAGGYTTALYGRPKENVQALQIEINRDLYLDENAMEKTAGFDSTRQRLSLFVEKLLAQGTGALPETMRLRA